MKMYFLALLLPERINEKIVLLKTMMRDRYHCLVGLRSPAHITLVPPFWMDEKRESEIKKEMEKLGSIPSFSLSTNHFAAFPPRTIFIDLVPNPALHDLKKNTDAIFSQTDLRIKSDTRPFHPHITIATRDLTKKNFHEAWPWFENKIFEEAWTADSISLLCHNSRQWEVIHSIGLVHTLPSSECRE